MPSSQLSTRPVVVARGHQDLLDLVPYRLGFHPADSLVLLELRAPDPRRRAVGFALRVDLPATEDPATVRAACAPALRAVARNLGAGSQLWVLLYDHDGKDDGEDDGEGTGRLVPGPRAAATLEHVRAELTATGTDLGETVLLTRDRWRSLGCDQPCCPPGGRRLKPHGALTAEAVGHGLVAAPDRASSLPTTDPVDPTRRAQADTSRRGWTPDARGALADFQDALARRTTTPGVDLPPADWCGRMLAAFADVAVRDALLLATPGERGADVGAAAAALAIDVARHGSGAAAAGAWAAAAWWEWNGGRGPRAQACVEAALRADPGHRLARLVSSALLTALPPRP